MKQGIALLILLILALVPLLASAAPFSPAQLKISAMPYVQYGFDGSPVSIPLTLEGGPATAILALFTRDRGASISNVRSGNLGWHYVNGIDTCFYLSPPHSYPMGMNTVTWSGKDNDGRVVPAGNYTYYLWGFSEESSPGKAAGGIRFTRFDLSHIQTRGPDGKPLANPVLHDAPRVPSGVGVQPIVRTKWVIGGDPSDLSLSETTAYAGWAEHSRLALDSSNHSLFFVRTEMEQGFEIRKFKWIPNGNAELQTDWGNGGSVIFDLQFVSKPVKAETTLSMVSDQPYSGPVTNGNGSLFFTETWINIMPSDGSASLFCGGIVRMDEQDGSIQRFFTPSPTPMGASWKFSGIGSLIFGTDMLFSNSPSSCLTAMIDPSDENATDCVRWINGNGDFIGDKNFEPDSPNPWQCTDASRSPIFGPISADIDHFSLFPVENLGNHSFGLFLPDGTGAGYFTLPGMENGSVRGLHVVDTGSAFDGVYYGGVTSESDSSGVLYTGYDVCKGIITSYADNFGPPVYFTFNQSSEPLKPGIVFTIAWEYYWQEPTNEKVRIDVSFDNCQTWTVLADSLSSKGKLEWTVPAVSSSACWFALTGVSQDEPWSTRGPFTIDHPVHAADDAPGVFRLHPNSPNPFNPSTTISFTLPSPGYISLTVYDITGRKVAELARGFQNAGRHTVVWNAESCASGVYFCVLKAGKATETRKMLLMR